MVTYGRWSLTICGCTWRFNGITFVACFSQELSWILHNTMAGRFDRILLVILSMLHDIGIQFPHVAHLRIHIFAYPPNLGYSLEVTGYSAVKPWWPLWAIKETSILLQQREINRWSKLIYYCKLLIISPPLLPFTGPSTFKQTKKNIRLCKPPPYYKPPSNLHWNVFDFLKIKEVIKFDQQCYVACFQMLFLSSL